LAEPDVGSAATALRAIHDDPAGAHAVGTPRPKPHRTDEITCGYRSGACSVPGRPSPSVHEARLYGEVGDPRVAATMEGRTLRSRYVD
jgi:hypothetical protein